MAAFLIGQPDPNFKPRHQQVRTAPGHPSGPGLNQLALVDELRLFVTPVVLGGGKRALPDGVRLALELLDERRFDNGVVHLRYRTRT
jgi:hypothetical protein